MRVAIKMQNNVVVLVREWDDAVPITDINASEIDGPWIELPQPVTVNLGYAYDRERDEFVPPDWTLINGVWTAPPVEPLP